MPRRAAKKPRPGPLTLRGPAVTSREKETPEQRRALVGQNSGGALSRWLSAACWTMLNTEPAAPARGSVAANTSRCTRACTIARRTSHTAPASHRASCPSADTCRAPVRPHEAPRSRVCRGIARPDRDDSSLRQDGVVLDDDCADGHLAGRLGRAANSSARDMERGVEGMHYSHSNRRRRPSPRFVGDP